MKQEKYKVIYQSLLNQITNGDLKSGDKIPDELNLTKTFKCSRMTVKKGLDLLVQDGLIYRKKGLGSFVMNQKNQSSRIQISERDLTGLSMATNNPNLTSDIIKFELQFASPDISNALEIKENDPIYFIKRLRLIDNRPIVSETTYMSTSLTPGINVDVLNHSVYNYIEKTLGLKIGSAKKITRAAIATEEDRKFLKLKENEPVLEVEQISYLDNGMPFEFTTVHHRYDCFEFTTFSLRR